MNQEAQQRILGYFIEESRDHLTTIEQGLLSLRESLTDGELINELFRAAHSIKGGAAMLNLGPIQRVAHRMEDFFNVFRAREGRVPVDQHLESLLLQGYDVLALLLEELQSPGGLSEETGRKALEGLEPVFAETENHLYSLLGETNPNAAPVVAPAAASVETIEMALNQHIPQQMREMLELFKQRDQSGTRDQLLQVVGSLQEIGRAHHLSGWEQLTEAIHAAIANPASDLRSLALIVLRDLKQSQQALVLNPSIQVKPSAELVALSAAAPVTPAVPEPPPMTDSQRRIMGFFLEEAQEHLQTIEQGLLNLRQEATDSELINELFRAAHSIKGGSAQLGFHSIQKLAHRLEDCFSYFRNHPGGIPVDQSLEGLFLKGYDGLARLVGRLQDLGVVPEAEGEAVWVEMQPVFNQAEQRIQQLLAGDKAEPEEVAPPVEEDGLTIAIQQTIPQALRQMLDLFKQGDGAQAELLGQVVVLQQVGQDHEIAEWVALVDGVKEILVQPHCSMATVALPILRNLKQAHQCLVAGSWDQIQTSADLIALRPEPMVAVEPDIFEDLSTLSGDEEGLVEDEMGIEADAIASGDDLGSESLFTSAAELDSAADADAMTDLFDSSFSEAPESSGLMEPALPLIDPEMVGQDATSAHETVLEEDDSFASVFGTFNPDVEPSTATVLEEPFDLNAPIDMNANDGDFSDVFAASPEGGWAAEEQDLADLLGEGLDAESTSEGIPTVDLGEQSIDLPDVEIVTDLIETSDLVDLPQAQIEDAFNQVFDALEHNLPPDLPTTPAPDPWLDMDVLLIDEISGIPEDVDTDLVTLFESFIPDSGEDLSLEPQMEAESSPAAGADLASEHSIQVDPTSSFQSLELERAGEVTGADEEDGEPDLWDTLSTEQGSTPNQDEPPVVTPSPEEDFAPALLTLDADDEAAFADLFDNAVEQAATEEIPDMEWINQSSQVGTSTEQPEWSEAVIEAKADQDLADLFGDLSEELPSQAGKGVDSSAVTDVLEPPDSEITIGETAHSSTDLSDDLPDADESLDLSFFGAPTQILDAPDLSAAEEQASEEQSIEDVVGDPFAETFDSEDDHSIGQDTAASLSESQADPDHPSHASDLVGDVWSPDLEQSRDPFDSDGVEDLPALEFTSETEPETEFSAFEEPETEDSPALNTFFQGDPGDSSQDEDIDASGDPFTDFEVTDFNAEPVADQGSADAWEDNLDSGNLDDLFADLSQLEQEEAKGSLDSGDLADFFGESSSGEGSDVDLASDLMVSESDVAVEAIELGTDDPALDVSEAADSDDGMFGGLDDLFGETPTDETGGWAEEPVLVAAEVSDEMSEPTLDVSEAADPDDDMFGGLDDLFGETSTDETGGWAEEPVLVTAQTSDETSEPTLDVSETADSDDDMFGGLDDLFGEAPTDEIDDGVEEPAAGAEAHEPSSNMDELSPESTLGLSETAPPDGSMFAGLVDLLGEPSLDENQDVMADEEEHPGSVGAEFEDMLSGLDDLFPDEMTVEAEEDGIPVSGLDLETAEVDSTTSDFNDLDALFADDLMAGFGGETQEPSAMTGNTDNSAAERETNSFVSHFEQDLDNLWNDESSEGASNGAGDNFEPRLDHLAALFDSSDEMDLDPSMGSTIPASAMVGDPSSSSAEGLELDLDKELEAILGDLDLGTPSAVAAPTSSVVAPPPTVPTTTRRTTGFSNQMMRVEVRHLDQINNLVGELVVNRNSMEQNHVRLRQFLDGLLGRVQQLSDLGQQMQDQYDRSLLETALLSGSHRDPRPALGYGGTTSSSALYSTGHQTHGFDALEMDRFSAFHALSQEIIELIVRVRESSSDIEFAVDEAEQVARQFRQVTTQLQEGLNRARMMPFSQIADRLPRAIRDLSIKTGKQATLEVDGRDTSIDKAILEELYDPMTHLVNNALVHGIETPSERKQAGKNPEGKITIRIFYQGNQSIIIVSDDGGGIPVDKVRNKAVGLGLLDSNASEDEVFNVLFHPGFSGRSAEEVDDLAGRGVGLDVVRRNISELRGSIQIDSALGKGTTFTIRLPLTLSISKAMVCVSNKALIAFPLDGVEEMLDVPQDEIINDEQGRPTIPWRDQRLHFQPLSQLLKFSRPHGRRGTEVYSITQDEGIVPVVIIQSSGNFVALQVDSFVEEQEIVIKQLRGPVPKPLGVAGATVLGNGRVLPIADILELVDLAQGRTRRELSRTWEGIDQGDGEEEQEHQTTVLIVDDSITVRELLSMSFQKVGYRVEQARDGQDAWEKLRGGLPCDIIFCDIEMPRMDGLQLLSHLRQDPHLQHMPIAMLTSRGAERHRQTARELGATAYFTKPYLEEELLSAAHRMLQGELLLTTPVTTPEG